MSSNDFWVERHRKHIHEGKVTDEERERDAEFFMNEYLQSRAVNPRGVITHLIPSAQYSTKAERDRYEDALVNGV